MRRARTLLVSAVAYALLAYGLSGCGEDADSDEARTLTVYAAASLSATFTELGERFEDENPGVEVALNLGGSSDLVAQVDQGAPADVLATADEVTMAGVDASQLAAQPQVFATNTLTLAVPRDNPGRVTRLADVAAGTGTQLVVCAPEVPCGAAAVHVAEGAGIELAPVSEEQNVTDVLGKVRAGEADAGLVYETDVVTAGDAVRRVAVPEAAEVVNAYPVAPLARAADDDGGEGDDERDDLAAAFVAYVLGEVGREVLAEAGFGLP